MSDAFMEKLMQSIRKVNGALLEVSEKTIWSEPRVKGMAGSTKARWLGEKEMLKAFHESFESFQVDEKLKELGSCNINERYQKSRQTVAERLREQKELLEKENEKLVQEQGLIESNILNTFKHLNNIPCPDPGLEVESLLHV